MAEQRRNIARRRKKDTVSIPKTALRPSEERDKIRVPKEPVPSNISPYFMGDEYPFISRTGKGGPDRVGPISAAPGTSEDATRINLSKREGDRFERSEYKMPSESGRTISDADRKRIDALVGEIIGGTKKPKPRPDVGAIERGNNSAKRTAQDLATQNFEAGGEAKVKKRKKSKGNMCRGGGAALRGTKFSGVR